MTGTAGIPWYAENDYRKALSLFEDPENLPKTFREWEEQAEDTEAAYRRRGFRVFRVPLAPAKFAAWCKRGGLRLDKASRRQFGAMGARRMASREEER